MKVKIDAQKLMRIVEDYYENKHGPVDRHETEIEYFEKSINGEIGMTMKIVFKPTQPRTK